ncbi:MAG: hypothetical protein P1P83_06965 [Bacteroidales bacterium]|nr:hypothetical protein [Bacteroidales bacterium]MDT8374975.1 hypothetical protein [Bacteroidales bacterium]
MIYYNGINQELILWGDPAGGEEFARSIDGEVTPEQILSQVYGHYYFLLLNKTVREIIAGNSVFSILPVYYYETNGEVVLSDNAIEMGKYLGLESVSRRFILETILFNYPLFNQSIVESVKLLPSNSYMKIGPGALSLVKHTFFENYFSQNPVPWRKAANDTSDAFLEMARKYFPGDRYVNALTGGLDSRTLVAAGLAAGRNMLCYSFGAPGSKDVEIPDRLTAIAGLPYEKILLDGDYARNDSLKNGIEFVMNASGSASFARGHYLYAVRAMAKHSRYMITGNFGSELFRAANVRGVVFPPNLISMFSSESPEEAFKIIESSREFNSLRMEGFTAEWDQLKRDLRTLPCFNSAYSHLTLNQKFYLFVFEEVFRKYFGAEMVNQFRYLRNRTPYIDAGFLKTILGTGFAGIYSDFFERKPFKRYKGQVLYAHIIKKSRPDLGKIVTDKGYSPNDLLTLTGKINVIRGYLKKKINKANALADPYSVDLAFRHNIGFWKQVPVDFELFKPDFLTDAEFARPDGHLIMVLSLSLAKVVAEGREVPGWTGDR